jgi:hypothetical protein
MENLKEDLISIISKRVDNAKYVDVADAVDEIIQKHIKDLQHHKDSTIGLYVIDKMIDDIFTDTPEEKDCKTVVEAYLVQQFKRLKSLVWQIS